MWARKFFIPKGGWYEEEIIDYNMFEYADKPPGGPKFGRRIHKVTLTSKNDRDISTLLNDSHCWVGLPINTDNLVHKSVGQHRQDALKQFLIKNPASPYLAKIVNLPSLDSIPKTQKDRLKKLGWRENLSNDVIPDDASEVLLSIAENLERKFDDFMDSKTYPHQLPRSDSNVTESDHPQGYFTSGHISPQRGSYKPKHQLISSGRTKHPTDFKSMVVKLSSLLTASNRSFNQDIDDDNLELKQILSALRKINAPMKFSLGDRRVMSSMDKITMKSSHREFNKSSHKPQQEPKSSHWHDVKQSVDKVLPEKSRSTLWSSQSRLHFRFRYTWLPQPVLHSTIQAINPTVLKPIVKHSTDVYMPVEASSVSFLTEIPFRKSSIHRLSAPDDTKHGNNLKSKKYTSTRSRYKQVKVHPLTR